MAETCVEMVQALIRADGTCVVLPDYALSGWTCPQRIGPVSLCEQTAVEGASALDHRAPFQDIIIRRFRCPDGHVWGYETDGG